MRAPHHRGKAARAAAGEAMARKTSEDQAAHPLEMPYLTGRSEYPPPDPTVGGGVFSRLSPLFPKRFDSSPRMRELPADGLCCPALEFGVGRESRRHPPGLVDNVAGEDDHAALTLEFLGEALRRRDGKSTQ